MRDRTVIACAMLAACGFHPTVAEQATPDAPTTDQVGSSCGPCAWSCIPGDPPHCGSLVPSGGAVTGGDLVGSNDATITATIDTGDGMNMKPKLDGVEWTDYRQVNDVTIFRVRDATVTGTVVITGKLALAIVATGSVTIAGVLDGTSCGPGSRIGGFPGGTPHMAGLGSGGGAGSDGDGNGGGGGGNGGAGGAGGSGIAGGSAYGAADLTVAQLVGGGGGGGGTGGGGPNGGHGGAAIQIVSNVAIAIGASGGVNAGGCGGGGSTDHSGGGGGAGGTILLEAPHISLAGTLAVNGGGGGGGLGVAATRNGSNGTLDRVPAPGGLGAAGGSGAAGGTLAGADGTTGAASGGGGGGIGRIRFDTSTGEVDVSGTLSPALDDHPTTCTAAPARVQ